VDDDSLICPVCRGACAWLDVVDFNKSCEEARGKYLPLSGVPVYYAICGGCGFCFAPGFSAWTFEDFETRIYNEDYVSVDPDYVEARPRANANLLLSTFGSLPASVRHLDYGGGSGALAHILRQSNWNSASYDPFIDRGVEVGSLGKYDLITAFEVFEHVPDVQKLMSDLRLLLSSDGIALFSTLLSDGNLQPNQRINWWYASPRNGHISLFSRNSLVTLARGNGWNVASFSQGLHLFFTSIPPWAAHVIRTA
jgi:SAM-dependent methyltransferase